MNTCKSCKYSFANQDRVYCRRYPPIPEDPWNSRFPTVTWDTWCGEWTPRLKEEPIHRLDPV